MSEKSQQDEASHLPEHPGGPEKIQTGLVQQELENIDPTIFQDIPQQARERIVDTVSVFVSTSLHEGPLPSVRTLEGYDKLIPDGAHRINPSPRKSQATRKKKSGSKG